MQIQFSSFPLQTTILEMRLLQHHQLNFLKRIVIQVPARLHSQDAEIQVIYLADLPHLHPHIILHLKFLLQLQLFLHAYSLTGSAFAKLTVQFAFGGARLLALVAVFLIIIEKLFPKLRFVTGLSIELLLPRSHLVEPVKEIIESSLFLCDQLAIVGSVSAHVAAHPQKEDQLDQGNQAG